MMDSLGILFGLIAMVGYGVSSAMAQRPLKALGVVKTIFYRNLVITAINVLLIFLLGGFFVHEPLTLRWILITLGISVFGYIPFITYYKGLRVGKVGVVSPVAQSSVLITIILSVIFFHETLTGIQIAAVVLVVVGLILISVNFKEWHASDIFHFTSGVPYVLMTTVLWGAVYFLWKIPSAVIGPLLTAFFVEGTELVLSMFQLKIRSESFQLTDRAVLPHLIVMGILGAAGTLFYTWGITLTQVSIVVTLTMSNSLIATLYGRLVYKEKLTVHQYVAGALIIGGIVMITMQ